ncbi:hypothetical protein Rcae01_01046 [Novipirellula caenicola]|uniref:Uncharacterized protein n=1 Tax=Novipirellula caenicola TaxID=1536901 RepID=A0ABP9VLD1_9BACT
MLLFSRVTLEFTRWRELIVQFKTHATATRVQFTGYPPCWFDWKSSTSLDQKRINRPNQTGCGRVERSLSDVKIRFVSTACYRLLLVVSQYLILVQLVTELHLDRRLDCDEMP